MQRRKVLIFSDPRPTAAQLKARDEVTRELYDSQIQPDVSERNRVAANIKNCWEPNIAIIYANENDETIIRVYEEKNKALEARGERTTEIRKIKSPKPKAKKEAPKKEPAAPKRTKAAIQKELVAAKSDVDKAGKAVEEAKTDGELSAAESAFEAANDIVVKLELELQEKSA